MQPERAWRLNLLIVPVCLVTLFLSVPAQAQEAGGGALGDGPSVSSSGVGYIDPAIPGNVLRFRYDAAYNNRTPTRSEFFYARTGPLGPGLRFFEPNVDFQDISTYLEKTILSPRFSAFVEVPVRFADYDVNQDHAGLADITAGFKFAFLYQKDHVGSFQLRAFAPTGDADKGLGTNHASLEPAFLFFGQWTEKLVAESELRLWIPMGGTPNFQGEVVRYGLGFRYNAIETCNWTIAPVVETVGWTFIDGQKSPVLPSGVVVQRGAGGDTVVNVKTGMRFRFRDFGDVYGGYGRALTGEVLYKDMFRLELRVLY